MTAEPTVDVVCVSFRLPAALEPEVAERFLTLAIREVIRHQESIPRTGATQIT